MASKKDMPCNKPRASTSKGKKKMVKACKNLWAGPGGSKKSCPKGRKCKG